MEVNLFYSALSMLFSQFPDRVPQGSEQEKDAIYSLWKETFSHLSGREFDRLIRRFLLETPKLYPGDNVLGMLFQMSKPELTETEGDCIELAFQAARDFGYMREAQAMAWLKEKSSLVAATVQRFGFREICISSAPDVVRGQLRAIFKGEKDRARQAGGVVESAKDLSGGLPDNKRLLMLVNKVNKSLPGVRDAQQ